MKTREELRRIKWEGADEIHIIKDDEESEENLNKLFDVNKNTHHFKEINMEDFFYDKK